MCEALAVSSVAKIYTPMSEFVHEANLTPFLDNFLRKVGLHNFGSVVWAHSRMMFNEIRSTNAEQ